MSARQQALAQAVMRAAARCGNPAARRSAAQAEIVLGVRAKAVRGVELQLSPAEEAEVRRLQASFDLDRVIARGRTWQPRARTWADTYSQDW